MESLKYTFKCQEKWSGMSSVEKGRYCHKCQTKVIDFDSLTNSEILDIFKNLNGKRVCAKSNENRLRSFNNFNNDLYSISGPKRFFPHLLTASMLFATNLIGQNVKVGEPIEQVSYQQQIDSLVLNDNLVLSGLVLNNIGDDVILGTVALYIDGDLIKGAETNFDGIFEMLIDKNTPESAMLEFSYVGFQSFKMELKEFRNNNCLAQFKEGQIYQYIGLIGEVDYIKPPLHKRIWYKVKSFFRRKN